MIAFWVGLLLVILTCVRRLFFGGSFLCFVSLVNFILILLLYYTNTLDFEYYVDVITGGAIVAILIGLCSIIDNKNLTIHLIFAIFILVTMALNLLRAYEYVNSNVYLFIAIPVIFIEILIINIGFGYVRGMGLLNNIKTNSAFFHNWSCYFLHMEFNRDQKIRINSRKKR